MPNGQLAARALALKSLGPPNSENSVFLGVIFVHFLMGKLNFELGGLACASQLNRPDLLPSALKSGAQLVAVAPSSS